MIDLHTHSLLSDGVLLPSELIRRAAVLGVKALAITDHADHSNLELILSQVVRLCEQVSTTDGIAVLPGIELTYVPPGQISFMAQRARQLGARLVLVHGESIVEPVIPGTNRAAIEAQVDILAHPGLISEEEVQRAAELGVSLEITARKGHCLANGWVARLALKYKAELVLNSDAHDTGDLISPERARDVALGAGLTLEQYESILAHTWKLISVTSSGQSIHA